MLAHAIYDPGWRGWSGLEMKPAELLDFSDEQTILEHLFKSFIQAAYRPGGTQEKGPITRSGKLSAGLVFSLGRTGWPGGSCATPRRPGSCRSLSGSCAGSQQRLLARPVLMPASGSAWDWG